MYYQPLLFESLPDKPLSGTGAVRTWSGSLMEEVVCAAMGWRRLSVDCRKGFCADAVTRTGADAEIKSVALSGRFSGKSVIYDFRMRKEEEHSPNLVYAFAGHIRNKSSNPRTLAELIDNMANREIRLAVVPASSVRGVAAGCPLLKIKKDGNPRNGYNRVGYRDGYRNVPVGGWFEWDSVTESRVLLYGREFRVLTADDIKI